MARPSYRNLCTGCGVDFSSVKAFDAHRVGVHAYDFAEGLETDPPREDGRRCLDEQEMLEAGLELDTDTGRWCVPTDEKDAARFAVLRDLPRAA
jgi:hypothetical protein